MSRRRKCLRSLRTLELLECRSLLTASVFISDATANESTGTMRFSIRVINDQPDLDFEPFSLSYSTVNNDALAGTDYEAKTGTISFGCSGFRPCFADTFSGAVSIGVKNDLSVEPGESFVLNLSRPSRAGVVIVDGEGIGTIVDDDVPGISVLGITKAEGDSGLTEFAFPIVLDHVWTKPISVTVSVRNGEAGNGDYDGEVTRTVTIPAGRLSANFVVGVFGDTQVEDDETFTVNLSNPVNGRIAHPRAIGRILNDDSVKSRVSIRSTSVVEGSRSDFRLSLDRPSSTDVSVEVSTNDGTATSPNDYDGLARYVVRIPAGVTSATIPVNTRDDSIAEDNETFTLQIVNSSENVVVSTPTATATIVDDSADLPRISVRDVLVTETDSQSSVPIEVILDRVSARPVSVALTTVNGSAVTGEDFVGLENVVVTVPAGSLGVTYQLGIAGDSIKEGQEAFVVNLGQPSGGLIDDGTGEVTIRDDDGVTPTSDFDGDGKSDLATYRASDGMWSIRLATGQGIPIQWGGADQVPVGGVDFDGDGKTDLASYRLPDGMWSIRLTTGQGIPVVWGGPGHVPVGGIDFDGDGKTDLASYRVTDGMWSIRLTTGQGIPIQWGGADQVPVGGIDFDGDGKTDLASYRVTDGMWSIRLATGQGIPIQWGGADQVPVGGMDFDGDGKTDLASYRVTDGMWSIRLATGQGIPIQWGGADQVPVGGMDFDGDGKTDLASYRVSDGWWSIRLATGQGIPVAWGGPQQLPVTLLDVLPTIAMQTRSAPAIGDLNGDGKDDVVNVQFDLAGGLNVRSDISNGDGTFRYVNWVGGDGVEFGPIVTDIDGDGRDDLVFHFQDATLGEVIRTKFSNGDGTYRAVQWVSGDGSLSGPVAADVNGDGKSDLVFHFNDPVQGEIIRTKFSNGDGTYQGTQWVSADGALPGPLVADVNGDGKDDLVYHFNDSVQGEIIRTKFSNGDGTYQGTQWVSADGALLGPLVADANGDGKDDLVYHFNDAVQGEIIRTKFSNGDGTYQGTQWVSADGALLGPLVADVDGDGKDDLIYHFTDASKGDVIRTKFSNGDGTYRGTQWEFGDSGYIGPIVGDFNGDRKSDLLYYARNFQNVQTTRVVFSNGDGTFGVPVGALADLLPRVIGDANADGRFDSSDLVRVFQIGKYENADATDAAFSEGDWNGDGVFDSSDIVLAFQAGNYEG